MSNRNDQDANSKAQDPKPWDRRVGTETPHAYGLFAEYLKLGPARSLRGVARAIGKTPVYVRQLERLSSQHQWVKRATAYDQEMISQALAIRPAIREDAIRRLAAHAVDSAMTIVEVMLGKVGAEQDLTPVLNRHGEEIGDRPVISASTRLQAAIRLQESIGIVPPKRMEISGPEGEAVRHALAAAEDLPPDVLAQFRQVLAQAAPTSEELAAEKRAARQAQEAAQEPTDDPEGRGDESDDA